MILKDFWLFLKDYFYFESFYLTAISNFHNFASKRMQ